MSRDIRPFGAGESVGFFWIQNEDSMGEPYLRLVAIDEFGDVTQTGLRAKFDAAAPNRQEAVIEHLAGAVSEADAKLERRQREAPDPEPEPLPMDRATRRFLLDD